MVALEERRGPVPVVEGKGKGRNGEEEGEQKTEGSVDSVVVEKLMVRV